MNVYSHVGMDEKAQAVASIPAPQNHQRDGQVQSPKDEEGGGGQVVAVPEPERSPVPSGAQNGALILALNGPEMTSNGTEEAGGSVRKLGPTANPKSLLPGAFGSEWHPLAPNATAPQMARSEVRPEGFEPPTLGSEDHGNGWRPFQDAICRNAPDCDRNGIVQIRKTDRPESHNTQHSMPSRDGPT